MRQALSRQPENWILAALPDSLFQQLEPDLRPVTLLQGTACFDADDPIDQVYFPQSGVVSLFVATGGDRMVATSSIGREGAVGLQCGFGPRLSFSRAVVQIPGKFSNISTSRFEQTPPATPFTTAPRACAAGSGNALTARAAISSR